MFEKGDIITTWDAGLKVIGTFDRIECIKKDGEDRYFPHFFTCLLLDEDTGKEEIITNYNDITTPIDDMDKVYRLVDDKERILYRTILNNKKEKKLASDEIKTNKYKEVDRQEKPNKVIDFNFSTKKQNIWFTSDTHNFHKNIINFCHRPFNTVEEMNETIINNWNSCVKEDDVVFCLGDFCFGGSKDWNETLDKLNGKKYLIIGNHDEKNLKQGYFKKFEQVSYMMHIYVDGQSIYLSHFPFLCYAGSYREKHCVWNLFGHVHSNKKNKRGLDNKRLAVLFPTQYDVGVDNNGFKPVSFSEVKEIIDKQRKSLKWKIKGKIIDFIFNVINKFL